MPIQRELHRENSTSRLIYEILSRPMTQLEISSQVDVTIGCACKCLKLLEDEGYVYRTGKAPNRKGTLIGMRPWLYARTLKPLPEVGPRAPAMAPSNELFAVMSSIIRRRNRPSIPLAVPRNCSVIMRSFA